MSATGISHFYSFAPELETQLVYYAVTSEELWSALGGALVAESFTTKPARLIVAACHVAALKSRSPGGIAPVMQKLRSGDKITLGDVDSCRKYLAAAAAEDLTPVDRVIESAIPEIKKHAMLEAAVHAVQEVRLGLPDDGSVLPRTVEMVRRAELIGRRKARGIRASNLVRLPKVEKLPLGVPDLDHRLDGGMARNLMGCILGASNSGKSMVLTHIGAVAWRAKRHVAIATLEMSKEKTAARTISCLTGEPYESVLDDLDIAGAAAAAKYGDFLHVQHFEPQLATFDEVVDWLDAEEQDLGEKIDVLITDYGDKLVAHSKKSGREQAGRYEMSLQVFESMRLWTEKTKRWHWTATQATRAKEKRKRLGGDDVSDSMHKLRVVDLMISLNPMPDGQLIWKVIKHREDVADFEVGPLSHDFERCRAVYLGEGELS